MIGGAVSRGPVGPLTPGARRTWAAAGGAIPSLGAVSIFGSGAVAPTLAADPVIDSKFGQVGKECSGSMRIHATGTGSLTGALSIHGLPTVPKYQGVVGEGGQVVGQGFMLDGGNAGRKYPVQAVIDPTFDEVYPIVFLNFGYLDVAGTPTATVPSFAGSPHDLVLGNNPFDFNATQFFINLTFAFEGV